MSSGDPFAEDGNADRTIITPNPGGRLGQTPRPQAPAAPPLAGRSMAAASPNDPALLQGLELPRLNPIVVAAIPLLNLAVRLKNRASHDNVEALRNSVINQINLFERRVAPLGLSPQMAAGAKYALCATIDDLVLNTPWGSNSVWSTQSIVATVFRQTWGGDRFFDLLGNLKREPANNLDLLELLYCCLALGFEGKYRVQPRGAVELGQVREDLYRLIRNNRGEFERTLAPHWTGVEAQHRGLASAVPVWVIAAVAAGILTVAYASYSYALNEQSDVSFATLSTLPPTGPVALAREAPPLPPPPPTGQTMRLKKFLEPEIQEGLVTVLEDATTITVRIRGKGMFGSGSADLKPDFTPILGRIGEAVNTEPGPLRIEGYTDNARIRSLKFPSNWHLSVARAKAVEALLAEKVKDPSRMTAEGKADADPIAPNTSPEGREQNRRIEIVLTKAS